jgi:hypothetical protein
MAVCTPALQAKVDSSRHMEAFRTPSGTGGRAKHKSLVMAKAKGGGKLHPLPFTTFGEILALGLKARVFCPSCYEHRPINPMAEHLRGRCFERAVRINRCPGGVDTVTCRVDRQYHDMRPTKRTVSQVR